MAFPEMEGACGLKPVSTLALQKHKVDRGVAKAQISEFVDRLKAQSL